MNEAGRIISSMNVQTMIDVDEMDCSNLRSGFVTSIRRFFGESVYMSKEIYQCRERQLFNHCLRKVKDKHELHKRRITGLKIINDITLRASPSYITAPNVINLVWCCMSCMHHFQLRLRPDCSLLVRVMRRRAIDDSLKTYAGLIRFFSPSLHQMVLSAIITFYRGGKVWEFECTCTHMILDLLEIIESVDDAITFLFHTALKAAGENYIEGRQLFQLLYDVLRKLYWHSVCKETMNLFLGIFEKSICPKRSDPLDYVPLRKSLELCIRNTMQNYHDKYFLDTVELCLSRINGQENLKEDILWEVGAIATTAARQYKVHSFLKSFTRDFLEMLRELSTKLTPAGLILSIRIWKNLIDRNNNEELFQTPRIFFQNSDYNLTIRKCPRGDKNFFKSLRHLMYELVLEGFRVAKSKWHLELLYQLMALTIVEIPCGYSVSTNVAMVMHLQEFAFKIQSKDIIKAHHLHAIVLSIMTLICYIHKADVLYKYVNDIMELRAQWAPHLNPPLLNNYEYAVHHVLWNQKDLFLQEWDAGYGLWKCFRQKIKKKKRRKKKSR